MSTISGSSLSVEVLGRYINLGDQGERIQTLVEIVPKGPKPAKVRTIRPRRVHPLTAEQIHELISAYEAGAPVSDLAKRFHIHRSTVFDHLNRQERRPGRYPALDTEAVDEAVGLYQSGMSLREVGLVVGVHADTVRRALIRVGITMRDSQGRER
jgi:DNA invertase Pin-like site-specific DNA recombinase